MESSKRFCAFSAVIIAEPIWAWSKRLSLLMLHCWHLFWWDAKSICQVWVVSLFVIAVVIAGTLVIVAVSDAVVVEKAWGAVMSFKLEGQSLSVWSPVDAVVVGTNVCLKCAELLCGSCKKLEVAIAGPLFANWIVLLGIFGLLQKRVFQKWMLCNLWNERTWSAQETRWVQNMFFNSFFPKTHHLS